MATDAGPEQRHEPTVERVYRNAAVEVTWEPSLCIHVAACLRGAPRVFNTLRRPWVNIDAERAERILNVVAQCPTGALHARPLDGDANRHEPHGGVTIEVRKNGPLFLRGAVRVLDSQGALLREDTRLALCRCGGSANKPYCDGAHRRIGFRD